MNTRYGTKCFSVRLEGRFSVPACTHGERRAERPSRLAAGHRRQAARRGLDGHEHDATVDQAGTSYHVLPGHGSFRGLPDAGQPQPGVGKAGTAMSRARSTLSGVSQRRARGCRASSRLGRVSAYGRRISGTPWLTGMSSRGSGNIIPAVFALIAPDPVHDDRKLARDRHFSAAHADALGESEAPCLER